MRGLKHAFGKQEKFEHEVASFTDAWIETFRWVHPNIHQTVASFTDAWIETYNDAIFNGELSVTSFTDAWIETKSRLRLNLGYGVASFTDAWIETDHLIFYNTKTKSHLLQMRGLKPLQSLTHEYTHRRIFYRCVD